MEKAGGGFSRTSPGPIAMGGSGEIGKRAGLGPQWGACDKENTPCEFKSRLPHHELHPQFRSATYTRQT